MSKVYFISDLHLGHRNIPKYREQYGDQFKTLESHNEFIISQMLFLENILEMFFLNHQKSNLNFPKISKNQLTHGRIEQ